MRFFWTFIFWHVRVLTWLAYVEGLKYYTSDTKNDYVTSKEVCTSRAGSLVPHDSIGDVQTFRRELDLVDSESYWIEGSGPSYITSESCLLLSSTIIVTNCTQKHFFICTRESSTTVQTTNAATIPKDDASNNANSGNSDNLLSSNSSFHFGQTSPSVETSPAMTSEHIVISETRSTVSSVTKMATTDACARTIITETGSYQCILCDKFCLSTSFTDIYHACVNITTSSHGNKSSFYNDTLTINVKETSKSIRKLTSALDSRTTSKAIGGFAIAIIFAVPVCVFLMDIPVLLKHLRCIRRNVNSEQ